MATTADYRIYAVRYAHRLAPATHCFIGADPHEGPLEMDYFVWAIVGGGRTVVVDVGFEPGEGARRGRTLVRDPVDGLGAIGIDPTSVEDVIITHMHYDHAGNLQRFPNARFHIQDTEIAYATGRAMVHRSLRHSYSLEDVLETVRMVHRGRVVFHDGDEEILPGLSVHHVPGHTRGLQSVRVRTGAGAVMVASDAVHFYDNLHHQRPYGTVVDIQGMMDGHRKVLSLATSIDHVVPGHDAEVMRRYPAVSPELAGVAVRLDVDPLPRSLSS
ncbi:MAG: N-acyl homoserine lactonase family protein [Ectothiorhodospiraceae bacterium]|nr:N-acyl homoserine lactonase family protein [Chromatiales bacterium]MCP5154217.1 N-acyl homoserine lactonase family protein [Ectothiorhodospiraceae bacterium]